MRGMIYYKSEINKSYIFQVRIKFLINVRPLDKILRLSHLLIRSKVVGFCDKDTWFYPYCHYLQVVFMEKEELQFFQAWGGEN